MIILLLSPIMSAAITILIIKSTSLILNKFSPSRSIWWENHLQNGW